MKIDVVKIASIGGVILGIAGTLVSSWANNKKVIEAAENLAKETLKNQK